MNLRVAAGVALFTSALLAQPAPLPPSPSEELNTLLMHATFRITGPERNAPGRTSFGTVFVMGVPRKDNPKISKAVLITAAHVLDDIGGDQATLLVRRRNAEGSYTAYDYNFAIRNNDRPLYVKNATADVAAMYVRLPTDVPVTGLPPDFLADDKVIDDIDLHPGDEVFCLGFPLLAAGPGGFPILRSGHIASYPLKPMKAVKQIDIDLLLYGGNSGGPVYYWYSNRTYKGQAHLGGWSQAILGLVIQSTTSNLPGYLGKPLNFGIIVPAPFIRETIDMLPPLQD